MSTHLRESLEDDYVVVEMDNISLERREQRPVICKILDGNSPSFQIFDLQSVKSSMMLQGKMRQFKIDYKTVIIHAEEYEPKHVRFVFNFVASHLSTLKGFTKTDEFKNYCNMFKIEEMEELFKVVGFFSCNTALIVVSWIQYELRKRARMENGE